MIPINNSDTAWLIVADYNQDNGKYHEELREDIVATEINQWFYEWRNINPDVLSDAREMGPHVGNGKCVVGDIDMGFNWRGGVGEGTITQGELVGGNEYDTV